jgi:MYXO-CTERM domain-containing protein
MTHHKTPQHHERRLGAGLALLAATTGSLAAEPVFFGPSAYLSAADIPVGFYAGGSPSLLDSLEDGSLHASLAGSDGSVLTGRGPGGVDSVDADDGVIDGTCAAAAPLLCRSWFFGDGNKGVRFSYQGSGPLPTAFGLVWTDGAGTITFSATGADGQNLGSFTATGFADGSFGGTTGEDRFFGIQFAGGIRAIHISNSAGGIEVDHLQYGQMAPVPDPASWALMTAGLLGIAALRRRSPRGSRP